MLCPHITWTDWAIFVQQHCREDRYRPTIYADIMARPVKDTSEGYTHNWSYFFLHPPLGRRAG